MERLYQLLDRQGRSPITQRRSGEGTIYVRELAEVQRQYSRLLAEMRRLDPELASFLAVEPRSPRHLRSILGSKEALIEYFIADGRLTTFVITDNRIEFFQQAISERNLWGRVELLRDRLQPRPQMQRGWMGPAESLHKLLIDPAIEKGLLENIQHLYIAPQGILHYLPFAALWSPTETGGAFLVERFQLAYLPSATTLWFARRKERVDSTTLLARAPQSTGLRFAQLEAQAVSQSYSPEAKAVTGREASEQLCKKRCKDYGVLHFATHGTLNKLNPLFSRIDLESGGDEDGRLEVFEIMSLELKANLVTLSACNTALGSGYFSEVPAGDEWVGLTRAFIYAGTPSVVATLWEVDDRSTTELMKAFYRYLPKMGKAKALAQAQRDFLESGPVSGGGGPSTDYRNPYYWAPFVLVGDAQ